MCSHVNILDYYPGIALIDETYPHLRVGLFIFGGIFLTIIELFLIGISLSMDAFAVSICKGLSVGNIKPKHMISAGLWFGGFQALMPAIGYILGSAFEQYITSIDHWIAFFLLMVIGINMIKESKEKDNNEQNASFAFKIMFTLAIATSIDALAVGITFAFLNVNIIPAITIIGVTTYAFGVVGIKIGSVFGAKYKSKAEFLGGVVLCCLGLKILIEHLFLGG